MNAYREDYAQGETGAGKYKDGRVCVLNKQVDKNALEFLCWAIRHN
jgi:hypothetical protein